MIHRANSEGLLKARHRVKRRRAKGAYIGFGRCHCQRLHWQNTREKIPAIERLNFAPAQSPLRRRLGVLRSFRRHTPHIGHIPPPSFA
jgi:hypothetical protein